MKLVAVTACPTGIAHCEMAAERLERTARERGHEIRVEVRGAAGVDGALGDADVEAADAAIVAAETAVDVDRFAAVPTVQATARDAIDDATGLVAAAEARVESTSEPTDASGRAAPDPSDGDGLFDRLRKLFR